MERKVICIATKDELNDISLLSTKLRCVDQALTTPPKGMSPNEFDYYYKACIDAKGSYQWLEKRFWDEVMAKYKMTGTVYIDFDTGEYYTLEAEKKSE